MLRIRNLCCLPMALICVIAMYGTTYGADGSKFFSPEAWRQAAEATDDWSREAMVSQLETANQLSGMDRTKVIALLGTPGYAARRFSMGVGSLGHYDMYRLSTKNDRAYVIVYDASDKVTNERIETQACACPLCTADAPAISDAGFRTTLLKEEDVRQNRNVTIAAFEALVGKPGTHSSKTDMAGAQLWVNYTDVWRVAGKDHDFLLAEGKHQAKDWSSDTFGEGLVSAYAFITLTPECAGT